MARDARVEHHDGEDVTVRPEPGRVENAPVGNLALWTGVLTGPVVFLILLETNYVLNDWACDVGHWWPMHVAAAVATAITAAALLLAWRNWVASGRGWPEDDAGSIARSRFLGALGVLASGGFVLVMIAQWIPVMLLGPCQHS